MRGGVWMGWRHGTDLFASWEALADRTGDLISHRHREVSILTAGQELWIFYTWDFIGVFLVGGFDVPRV